MVLKIPNNGTGFITILELMGRANVQVRFVSGNLQYNFHAD
jgi:hypothetical protein